MSNIVKWGIIGTGRIAHKFASDLQLVEHAKLIAVASRNQETANQFAAEFNMDKSYGSYEDLAKDTEVDAVYIATPHVFHYANAILCLENHKAVLCEKPFAMNGKQVAGMIATARKNNVFLMEALWSRFIPHYQQLMSMLEDKVIGEVLAVHADFGFKLQDNAPQRLTDIALGGGTLLDIGIYNVFFVLSILGRPDNIDAAIKKAANGIDEQCSVTFTYQNGSVAHLFSSFNATIPVELQIFGSKANIKLTHRFYEPSSTILLSDASGIHYHPVPVERGKGIGYAYEATHMTDCLLNGLKESPLMQFADSILLIETLDQIRSKAGLVYPQDNE